MAEVKLPLVELEKAPEVKTKIEKFDTEIPEEFRGKICSRAILLKRGDIICGDITAEDGWVTVSEPKKGDYTATELVFRERGPLAPKKLLIPREEVELIVEM